jgi:hypothetical protein
MVTLLNDVLQRRHLRDDMAEMRINDGICIDHHRCVVWFADPEIDGALQEPGLSKRRPMSEVYDACACLFRYCRRLVGARIREHDDINGAAGLKLRAQGRYAALDQQGFIVCRNQAEQTRPCS